MNSKSIALFTTCIVDQIMPEIGVATTRLLRRAGFTVAFPLAQTCCGQPFFNSGFRDQARPLAQRTIEILEPYDAIIIPGGSCTSMIRVEYPHLLQDSPPWHYAARRLAAKTFELSEFLDKLDAAQWLPPTANPQSPILRQTQDNRQSSIVNRQSSITYHDSCHMNRILGLRDEPRRLLQAVGYTIYEMAEADRCCGFGGAFSIRMPEVSNAMTAEKIRQARATTATTLVTADPGCLLQMRGMVRDADNMEVKHLAVALEEAITGEAVIC
ncbi:MAG: (Fe-S)-binding protein [Anaerolinea sp.]|nr:(Fe-S)-binding protein [Anaerolinea sp.]